MRLRCQRPALVSGECSPERSPFSSTPKSIEITEAGAPCKTALPPSDGGGRATWRGQQARSGGSLAAFPFKSGALDFPSCEQPRPPSSPQIATLTRLLALAPASRPSLLWTTGTPHSSPRIGGPSVHSAQTQAVVTGPVFHQSRNAELAFLLPGVVALSFLVCPLRLRLRVGCAVTHPRAGGARSIRPSRWLLVESAAASSPVLTPGVMLSSEWLELLAILLVDAEPGALASLPKTPPFVPADLMIDLSQVGCFRLPRPSCD